MKKQRSDPRLIKLAIAIFISWILFQFVNRAKPPPKEDSQFSFYLNEMVKQKEKRIALSQIKKLRPANVIDEAVTKTKIKVPLSEKGKILEPSPVSTPQIKSQPSLIPSSAPPDQESSQLSKDSQEATPTAENQESYIIKQGDTLASISAVYLKYEGDWPRLWSYNPQISNPHDLTVGQSISLIPQKTLKMNNQRQPSSYLVQQGDSIPDIAKKLFGDTSCWPKLWATNAEITDPYHLTGGTRLRLTGAHCGQ